MPSGLPYFSWVEPEETTFGAEHLRWDENIFEFELGQEEGNFAHLSIVIRNPRVGPLAVGRKIYCWFAFDCGGDNLLKFFGRLVGVPSNLIGDVITFEFVARPSDYEAQKAALAETLKILPYYDRVFVDPQAEIDPDVVLEGYGAIWHIDRETHAVTISDELVGEDGTPIFDPEDMLFDGLEMNISGAPASIAQVDAVLSWTQLAAGTLDLTAFFVDNWPNEPEIAAPGTITSFTLSADSWPQNETSVGDGWTVVNSSCQSLYDFTVQSHSSSGRTIYKWASGSTTTLESSESSQTIEGSPGTLTYGPLVTQDESEVQYGDAGDAGNGLNTREVTSFSRNFSSTSAKVPLFHLKPHLEAAYDANRPFTEEVRLVVISDVQPVFTEPEDGMMIRLSNLRSVNLSEPLGGETGAEVPIGDPRRRSYIATARGQDSLRHLVALARATLRRQSRAVQITIKPLLARMHEVTLRKSALVVDDRIPGGEAAGKILAYTLALSGDSGAVDCSVTIGCAIGRGGTVTVTPGTPEYVEDSYIAQAEDYQEYSGRIVLFDDNADIGFTPPLFNPNDDGLDFISGISLDDVIEESLTVDNPPAVQREALAAASVGPGTGGGAVLGLVEDTRTQRVSERSQVLNDILQAHPTTAHFKLRSMTDEFESTYDVEVTGLKVPQMINLEGTA